MKYEAVFGDQSLFDNAPLGTELVGHSGGFYKNSPDGPIYCGGCTFTTDEYRNIGFIAARRVIRTPTWTVEDHKAGRLPPAGSKYLVGMHNIELECLYNDSKGNAWGFDAQGEVYGFAIKYCSPIETPEEKAERLRNEWINEAINAVRKTDVNGYESIYDALLSGTLSVPAKGGE